MLSVMTFGLCRRKHNPHTNTDSNVKSNAMVMVLVNVITGFVVDNLTFANRTNFVLSF